SNRFPLEAVEELYEGIKFACDLYKVDLIGGDTTSSNKGLLISVTAIGEINPEDVVYRSGAQSNDLLVVTGDVGGAYLGLQVLEREKQVFQVNPQNQPDLDQYSYIIERQLKPEARKDIPKLLKELNVKSIIESDVSYVLFSEIINICKLSKVVCNLYEDNIPLDKQTISTCEELNISSTKVALSGGEDYELLFTISHEDYPKIKENHNLII